MSWLYSEWTWTSVCMLLSMSLIYRFAMSREPVAWRASIAGGVASAVLALSFLILLLPRLDYKS